MKRLLVSLLLIGAVAPLAAQQAVDAWVPEGSQAPIALRVIDPVNGDIEFKPVHATLLPIGERGRVMLFATVGVHARAAWFEPAPIGTPLSSPFYLTPDRVPVDRDPPITLNLGAWQYHEEETIFCSGHALTSDGGIFVAGGTWFYSWRNLLTGESIGWIYGLPYTTQYSLASRQWARGENMRGVGETGSNRRWYGTVTRLGDERMLVSSGFELADIQVRAPGQEVSHHGTTQNRSIEIMLPGGGGMVVSDHATTPRAIWNPDYTHVFQMPYGPADGVPANTMLMFGDAGVPVWFLPDQPDGSRWFPLSGAPRPGAPGLDTPNHGTASVLLPLRQPNGAWGYANGSVLQAGGARGSTMERSISIFEISSSTWANFDLGIRRRFPATVILPDGKVLVVSGYDYNALGQNPLLRNAHYLDLRPPASLATGTAASQEIRGYHNVALLLPDGRVLIGGGRSRGSAQGDPEDEKPNFRYLHPPYLASGAPRPVIASAPQTIGYGAQFTVQIENGPVSEVVLMGLGSMTHAIDMSQRYVQLDAVAQGDSAVQVSAPPNVQTASPGHYMLFVLNQNRIPSVAKFVRLAP
jgi:hypothetical protein